MPSNKAPTFRTSPLAFMRPLSNQVLLHRPEAATFESSKSTPTFSPAAPALILLLSWTSASDAPLAKYVAAYRALFPFSSILLVKVRLAAVNINSAGLSDARPAARAIRAILGSGPDANDDSPRLLVHALSAGGSSLLHHIYDAYAEAALSQHDRLLPRHATVFDSGPGEYAYGPSYRAVVQCTHGMARWARWLLVPAIHLLVMSWWVRIRLLGGRDTDLLGSCARSHNDVAKVREARRTYLYGAHDDIIPRAMVERHAREAEAAGFDVRREVFQSGHVLHAREEPERYWRVVRETWEGVGKRNSAEVAEEEEEENVQLGEEPVQEEPVAEEPVGEGPGGEELPVMTLKGGQVFRAKL